MVVRSVLVLLLAALLSGCFGGVMGGMLGAGAGGYGPGAEAAQAHGSWEAATAAYNEAIAAGLTPAEAAAHAAKGPGATLPSG